MIKHTIRTSENGRVEVDLTMSLAIKLKCVECMGYEENPSKCTAPLCPLYPFRGNTRISQHDYVKRELTEEQKQKLRDGLAMHRENNK